MQRLALEILYKFVLSIALILIAARIGGELFQRFLRQPPVVGELIAGIVISPFAVGGVVFAGDPIILNFATIPVAFGVSNFSVMEIISLTAVVVLLFQAGAETNVRRFVKLGLGGASVAIGGVVVPFVLGFVITSAAGFPPSGALFMGAVLTATSIGITVRILMDLKRLHSREGTTILVAAVLDDIIGIVILVLVVAVAATGTFDIFRLLLIGTIGFVAWFGILMVGVRLGKYVSRLLLEPFKRSGTMPVFALIIGFLIAYLLTLAGLHPVIGAYAAGLMFANTVEKEEIVKGVRPITLFLAPFFFTLLGMQVDATAIAPVAILSSALIGAAIVGKIAGVYIPARVVSKLDHNRSMIVGTGMVPRGEIGLIIAGVGLTAGAISRDLFGTAVAVSIATTLVAPSLMGIFLKRQKLQSHPESPSS
ncbi:MAG: cation:proton antiporter [Candidatus Bathyarchaeia archaeon]